MDTEGGDMSVTPIDEATNVPIADPVTPVAANAPVYQVEPVDPVETETPGVVEISNQARELATEYLRDATTRRNNAVEAEQEIIAENNQSVRDLMRALRDYDNSLAVTRYLNYIRTAAAYGTLQNALPDYDAIVSGASNAVYNLNNRVNNLNNYGSNTPPPVVRDSTPALSVRDNMIRSVANWLAGTGVF
ncbi:MAG: hypothetical protein LIP23_06700, partial [Planctomycetes bacterium]|nr:hypothetical protein [Planctomycetota bacterium]